MNRIAGRLLLASPYLGDGNFFRSVIYLVRHDAEGAFGLVLNRPGNRSLAEVFEPRLGRTPKRNDPIYLGGPVEGPLLALHTLPGLGEPCGPEAVDPASAVHNIGAETGQPATDPGSSPLWVTFDESHLDALVDRTDIEARFIACYSGWGPEQLDQELDRGGWLVGPPDWKTIFADHETMWENIVKKLGRDIISDIVSSPPSSDPQWN